MGALLEKRGVSREIKVEKESSFYTFYINHRSNRHGVTVCLDDSYFL